MSGAAGNASVKTATLHVRTPPVKAAGRTNEDKTSKMSNITEALPGALRAGALVCQRCGHEVAFAPRQWRKTCGRCGLVITLPRALVAEQQKEEQQPDCFLCGDLGLVFYQEQLGGQVYNFVARCNCRAGQQRSETGLPQVDQVDNICSLNYLAMQNRREWEKRTGKKARPTLLAGAVEVRSGEIPF
ncbi:hypothetical protein [Desulfolucanica intricata]|uniref:hypothetical protein n=1 Tax=Desulfolucanica intricata TaxID=1285191 RepID=UPI00083228E4|nr:hypothetical protein [Desulfolucanica intricata]